MNIFLGFLTLLLFIAMIVGLIKPNSIIFWSMNPKRIIIFRWWIISMVFIAALYIFSKTDNTKLNSGQEENDNKEYSVKVSALESMKVYADSVSNAHEQLVEKEKLAVLKGRKAREKKNKTEKIAQLKKEIKSIDNGIDFSKYRGTVDALKTELMLFGGWSIIITESLNQNDQQVINLASRLKSKVVYLQSKQFPIMRKEYAKVMGNLLWENDIEVHANTKGDKYINFTGGIFAANKNIKDFHNQTNETLKLFRFTQSRYRWYKGQDEYTYFIIYKGTDSDLVTFSK